MDKSAFILAGVVVSALGALFYNALPVYLGSAQDFRGLSNEQIGLIGTSFFLGYTLASASAFFWIRTFDWRAVSYLSLAVAALGLLLASAGPGYSSLLAGVFVAGCGFSGLYAVGTTLLGDTSNPPRWYGAKITTEAAIGVALLIVAPALVLPRWGFSGLSLLMVGILLVLAPVLLWLPAREAMPSTEQSISNGSNHTKAVWLALLASGLFMCGQTAIWSFVERIGASAGFDATLVGTLLAVSLAFAVGGSLLAAWLGNRLGLLKPMIVAHLAFFTGLAALTAGHRFDAYAVGSCLILFSVGLGISFAIASVAENDPDGRFVVLSVPAVGVGLMIGPGLAGWLSKSGDFGPILVFGLVTLLASLLMFTLASRQPRR